MCNFCDGCKRYMDAWKNITNDISTLTIGSRNLKNREDDRHFENLSTFKIKDPIKRMFSEFISEKKDTKVSISFYFVFNILSWTEGKKGKKKKIEILPEEEPLEEQIIEQQKEEEEELSSSSSSEEEEEELVINEDELVILTKEIDPDQPDEEPIDFSFEDVFDSDEGEEKKQKKRKKIE